MKIDNTIHTKGEGQRGAFSLRLHQFKKRATTGIRGVMMQMELLKVLQTTLPFGAAHCVCPGCWGKEVLPFSRATTNVVAGHGLTLLNAVH